MAPQKAFVIALTLAAVDAANAHSDQHGQLRVRRERCLHGQHRRRRRLRQVRACIQLPRTGQTADHYDVIGLLSERTLIERFYRVPVVLLCTALHLPAGLPHEHLLPSLGSG